MRILSANSMSLTDLRSMNDLGVDDITLVKRAALACFEIIGERITKDKKIGIVCGNSNNSSDGFCLANILKDNDYDVSAFYFFDLNKMNKTCRHFYDLVSDVDSNTNNLNKCDVLIDCIIGNGLRGPLRDDVTSIVEKMNECDGYKIAIDIPTGLDSTNGTFNPVCFKVDLTICINNIKLGCLLNDGVDVCKDIEVVDIGLKQYDDLDYFEAINPSTFKFNEKKNVNKYDFGSVLVIGSNVSMPGAGIMSSISALKAGCGLATLACPYENLDIVSIKAPYEVMVKCVDDEDLLNKKDTVVFGPGLKRDDKYIPLLRDLLSRDINLIVDADGLGLLSKIGDIKDIKKCRLVITPHIGEAARLLNDTSANIKNDILGSFKKLIDIYDCIVVLKGHNTLVGDKDSYFISLSGNAGMASAGSGDVLSGIIAGCALKRQDIDSVKKAVYIHGLAGDIAKEKAGETSLVASDIIGNISSAITKIKKEIK